MKVRYLTLSFKDRTTQIKTSADGCCSLVLHENWVRALKRLSGSSRIGDHSIETITDKLGVHYYVSDHAGGLVELYPKRIQNG